MTVKIKLPGGSFVLALFSRAFPGLKFYRVRALKVDDRIVQACPDRSKWTARGNVFGTLVCETFDSERPQVVLNRAQISCCHGGPEWLCEHCAAEILREA
jgi:hypothetical protein